MHQSAGLQPLNLSPSPVPTMMSAYAILLLLAHWAVAQFLEKPPTAANPNTIKDCTWWHIAASGETCDSIAETYGLTIKQFETYVSQSLWRR